MKEIITTVKDSINDRIKNPITGAFILSWIVFNWKPISLFLFSNENIENKIRVIERKYCDIGHNLWFPAAFAILYSISLPYMLLLLEYIRKKAVDLKKANIVKQQTVDIQFEMQLIELTNELEDKRARSKEKVELNEKISSLTNKLSETEEEKQKIKDSFDGTTRNYLWIVKKLSRVIHTNDIHARRDHKEDLQEYAKFKKSNLWEEFEVIASVLDENNLFPENVDLAIRDLYMVEEIITPVGEENEKSLFRLTRKGNFFWQQYNLELIKDFINN